MDKLYKLIAIGGLSFLVSSNVHYLLTIIESPSLKLLGYGSILTLAIMGVVLDDALAVYFKGADAGAVAIASITTTGIYLGGSYRAFILGDIFEGTILVASITIFWIVLLAFYIKLLLGGKENA